MSPRWESPLERPSPRDAALLAEVMDAIGTRPEDAADDPDAPDAPLSRDELGDLISAAVVELQRLPSTHRAEAGIAPVLGTGVVQELLRRSRNASLGPVPDAPANVDHRL